MRALGLERVIVVGHDCGGAAARGSPLTLLGWPSGWSLGRSRRDAFLSLVFDWTQTRGQTPAQERTRTGNPT